MNDLISIIIPIYNTENRLRTCLDSVVNQSYRNLEIILVDDGSTDNSGKIIEEYASRDIRIKAIHQSNSGQSTARNAGIHHVTGSYISFIDSDDQIHPDFIQELHKTMTPSTSLVVCGILYNKLHRQSSNPVYINSPIPHRKHQSKKAYILSLLATDGRLYSTLNKLYRAEIIKSNHLEFDKSLNFAEDTKFVLNYLATSKGKISFLPKPLYIYNFGTESSTVKKTSTVWQNWQKSYTFLKTWVGNQPTLEELFWLHLIRLRWRISYHRAKKRTNSTN